MEEDRKCIICKSHSRALFLGENVIMCILLVVFLVVSQLIVCGIEKVVPFQIRDSVLSWLSIGCIIIMTILAAVVLEKTGFGKALDKVVEYNMKVEFYEEKVIFFKKWERISVKYADIQEIMKWPLLCGRGEENPIAYMLMIKTKKREYQIYSELLCQESYGMLEDTELYQIYRELKARGLKCC